MAPLSAGLGAVVRIPVPGWPNLAIELRPRGWTPASGSTSTLFIQDISGRRHLRLDYGFNVRTNTVEWHWNQQGTHAQHGIANHTPAGRGGAALGTFTRYYRYAGRALVVVAAAADLYSIAVASNPLRRTVQVVSAWAAAGLGCRVVGMGGAALGSAAPGVGTAAGGLIGCAVGGFIGYFAAESASGYIYDWAEGTVFRTLEPTGS